MGSSGRNGTDSSVRLRDNGCGGGFDGTGGRDRNFEGLRGRQRPVGVPIVVITESHPNSSRIFTPSTVADINPSTKNAVLAVSSNKGRAGLPLEGNDVTLLGNRDDVLDNLRFHKERNTPIIRTDIAHSP